MSTQSSYGKISDTLLKANSHDVLYFLQKKASLLNQLNQIWQTVLPLKMTQHTRVANFREGHLVIFCDSSVWATRLHHMVPDLIQTLIGQSLLLKNLIHIEWKIAPDLSPSSAPHTIPYFHLPQHIVQLLSNTAFTINNPLLKNALLRIVEHQRSLSSPKK